MIHPSHKLDAYRDNNLWVTFCRVCSREESSLERQCPGKFVLISQDETIDNRKEQK